MTDAAILRLTLLGIAVVGFLSGLRAWFIIDGDGGWV